MLVLVLAVSVPEFPCQAAICKFSLDLVNHVMMGLFRSVVDVLKDCDKAGLAVTTDYSMMPSLMLWHVAMASVTITIARMPPSSLRYGLISSG